MAGAAKYSLTPGHGRYMVAISQAMLAYRSASGVKLL